jgi:hypothetical protein
MMFKKTALTGTDTGRFPLLDILRSLGRLVEVPGGKRL